jgi:hypothetical protein
VGQPALNTAGSPMIGKASEILLKWAMQNQCSRSWSVRLFVAKRAEGTPPAAEQAAAMAFVQGIPMLAPTVSLADSVSADQIAFLLCAQGVHTRARQGADAVQAHVSATKSRRDRHAVMVGVTVSERKPSPFAIVTVKTVRSEWKLDLTEDVIARRAARSLRRKRSCSGCDSSEACQYAPRAGQLLCPRPLSVLVSPSQCRPSPWRSLSLRRTVS